MKKLLVLLNIVSIMSFGIFGYMEKGSVSSDPFNLNNIENYRIGTHSAKHNNKTYDYNNSLKNSNYNPLYPSFSISNSSISARADDWSGNPGGYKTDSNEIMIYNSDLNNYSTSQLLSNYSISANITVYINSVSSEGNSMGYNGKYLYFNPSMNELENADNKIWGQTFVDRTTWIKKHWQESMEVHFGYKFKDDGLWLWVQSKVYEENEGGSGNHGYATITLNSISFNSKFSVDSLRDKAESAFNEPFTFLSNSSLDIDDDSIDKDNANKETEAFSFDDKKKEGAKWGSEPNTIDQMGMSNKARIEQYITKKLKSVFTDDYDAWFSYNSSLNLTPFATSIKYDDENNRVEILIKDNSKSISDDTSHEEGGFTSKILKLDVNIIESKLLFQKQAISRLSFQQGKIVDTSSNYNGLTMDWPEYNNQRDEKSLLTYHNSLKISLISSFNSDTHNDTEKLFLDNKEVPTLNHKSIVKLDDSNLNKKNDKIFDNEKQSHNLSVKGQNQTTKKWDVDELSFNFTINSVSSYLNFKMNGWNPDKNDVQFNLVNKIQRDGKTPSATYNPNIDKDTGVINQEIGISFENENDDNINKPFAFDPLNKKGVLISKLPKTDPSSTPKPFYIALGSMVNSGEDWDVVNGDKIGNIERETVDKTTLKPIGGFETIWENGKKTEAGSISEEGLYHYIIHLKNWVDHKPIGGLNYDNPTNTSNPWPWNSLDNPINAVNGSTIHQYVYLKKNDSKSKDVDYSNYDFLNCLKQKNISGLYDTYQGKHLLWYLNNDCGIVDTKDIQALKFDQINSYWLKYVSDAYEQKADIQPSSNCKDLSDLAMSELKMNTTSKDISNNDEKIRTLIEDDVKKKINSFLIKNNSSATADMDVDYDITVLKCDNDNINNVDVKSFDLTKFKDFGNPKNSNEIKHFLNIKIQARSGSLVLENSTTMKVLNDNKFDPEKCLDLSTIKTQDYSYNFGGVDKDGKNNWEKQCDSNNSKDYTRTLIDNYIDKVISTLLNNYKPDKFKKNYNYGKDYIVSIDGDAGKSIYKANDKKEIEENILKRINDFYKSSKKEEIVITFYSLDDSLVLQGSNSYKIINDPNGVIPPYNPPIPPKPNPDDNNNNNNISITKKPIFWVIMLLGLILIILLVYCAIIWRRKRVKRIK